MAEDSAVNRRVVGSSPTCGATISKAAGINSGGLSSLPTSRASDADLRFACSEERRSVETLLIS